MDLIPVLEEVAEQEDVILTLENILWPPTTPVSGPHGQTFKKLQWERERRIEMIQQQMQSG